MTTETIIEDAEIAACFFRTVVAKGVPNDAAASLTSSYLSSILFNRRIGEKPREPWEGNQIMTDAEILEMRTDSEKSLSGEYFSPATSHQLHRDIVRLCNELLT